MLATTQGEREGRRSTEVQAATHSVTNSNSGPPLAVGHGAEIKLLESRYVISCAAAYRAALKGSSQVV